MQAQEKDGNSGH